MGALLAHITGDAEAASYQPMNVNFGLFPPVAAEVKKKQRKEAYTARAKDDLAGWIASSPLKPDRSAGASTNSA
jgi:methylenetetrahydrofolate--tRNA-(uracil-5-)-methyltransferase